MTIIRTRVTRLPDPVHALPGEERLPAYTQRIG